MNSPIERILTNDPIAPFIIIHILGDEISDISNRDIYLRCQMGAAEETTHPVAPIFLIHGIPTIDTLDKNCGIWIPATRIRRTPNITHRSAYNHALGKETAVGYIVSYSREKNYKTDFETWNKDSKLQSQRKNIEMT